MTNTFTLPITEKEISTWTDCPVYAPILCASLADLNIDTAEFLNFYKDCFKTMPWDYYDVKRKQWEAIEEVKKVDKEGAYREYYVNQHSSFSNFIKHFELTESKLRQLENILPWRRRSVCSFDVFMKPDVTVKRIPTPQFEQQLESADIRSLPRIFEETSDDLIECSLFYQFLEKIAQYAQKVAPHVQIKQLKISAHFMSVKARKTIPGNNSPEGAHEDGADFIVSALVINRKNIKGAKSQVIEKMPDGEMHTIFEHELLPGQFLFQADTGEEKHYGNDLWHYVTPFYIEDETQEAWRDIIGLDISIVNA